MKTRPPAPAKAPSDFWIYALLAAAIFAAYGPVLRFGFVNYDDPVYLATNPHVRDGITWSGVVWAFTHSFAGNWFPLTWLSHMLDCQLFGNRCRRASFQQSRHPRDRDAALICDPAAHHPGALA